MGQPFISGDVTASPALLSTSTKLPFLGMSEVKNSIRERFRHFCNVNENEAFHKSYWKRKKSFKGNGFAIAINSFTKHPKLRQCCNHSEELFPAQLQFGNIQALTGIIMLFHTTISEFFVNTNSLSFPLLCLWNMSLPSPVFIYRPHFLRTVCLTNVHTTCFTLCLDKVGKTFYVLQVRTETNKLIHK